MKAELPLLILLTSNPLPRSPVLDSKTRLVRRDDVSWLGIIRGMFRSLLYSLLQCVAGVGCEVLLFEEFILTLGNRVISLVVDFVLCYSYYLYLQLYFRQNGGVKGIHLESQKYHGC